MRAARSKYLRARMNWREVALEGDTAHDFDAQVNELTPLLEEWWQVRTSERTGNPLYATPSVLVVYRADQRFGIDAALPRRDGPARMPATGKTHRAGKQK